MWFYMAVILGASLMAGYANIISGTKPQVGKIIYIFSALIMFFPLAMRNMGVDYEIYVLEYDLINEYGVIAYWTKAWSGGIEPLYAFLNQMSYIIFKSYQGVNFFCAALSVGFTFAGIYRFRKYINLGLTIWCFGFLYYVMMYGLNRQMIAVALITWSYQYFLSKNVAKYIFWVCIAGLFHWSAFLMIPLAALIQFVSTRGGEDKTLKLMKWIVILCGIIIGFAFIYLVVPKLFGGFSWFIKYKDYFTLSFTPAAMNNGLPMYFAIVLILIYKKELMKFFDDNKQLLIMYMFLLVLSVGSTIMPVNRVCYYFYPCVVLLYGAFPKVYKRTRSVADNSMIVVIPYYIVLFLIGIIWIMFYGNSELWSPYIIPYEMGNLF